MKQHALSPAARYSGRKELVLYWLHGKDLLSGLEYLEGSNSAKMSHSILDRLKTRYAWGWQLEMDCPWVHGQSTLLSFTDRRQTS
jgi:hypothetical protein